MQVIITAKMMAIKLYTAIFVSILGAENEKKNKHQRNVASHMKMKCL